MRLHPDRLILQALKRLNASEAVVGRGRPLESAPEQQRIQGPGFGSLASRSERWPVLRFGAGALSMRGDAEGSGDTLREVFSGVRLNAEDLEDQALKLPDTFFRKGA